MYILIPSFRRSFVTGYCFADPSLLQKKRTQSVLGEIISSFSRELEPQLGLYILEQVQSVYRSQGVDINDKHVEIIVRQMLRKVKIESAGSTNLLPGETVDMFTVEEENQKAPAGAVP